MTLYYVRKGGNDGNDGLSAALAHAWLTIDKAANTVAAADTVHVGPGVYREKVTMDTSGAAGSIISYLGDPTGINTGDTPGPIIVTAWDDEAVFAAARDSALDLNQKEFITWADVIFIGGNDSLAVMCTGAGNVSFEQLIFTRCVFHAGSGDLHGASVLLMMNNGATPATTGPTFNRCIFYGGYLSIGLYNNITAHIDAKMVAESCLFLGSTGTGSANCGIRISRGTTANAFSVGGFTLRNCTGMGLGYFVSDLYNKNTTNKSYALNCHIIGCYAASNISLGTAGAWEAHYSDAGPVYGEWDAAVTVVGCFASAPLIGGIHDLWMRHYYGWSPYQFLAPFSANSLGYLSPGLNYNDNAPPTVDLVGNPYSQLAHGALWYGWFDGSDAAATDPDNKWGTEANVVDMYPTTYGNTITTGSAVSNYVMAEGTNAPARTDVVTQVRFRIRAYRVNTSTLTVTIYTNGLAETLGNVTISNSTPAAWSVWTTLAAPAAGWTWADVAALEFKAWKAAGGAGENLYLYMIQIEVTAGAGGSVGAIAARNTPAKETATPHSGVNAMHFTGAGWHDLLIPVNAVATTVTVFGRFDGNYGGVSKPQMIAMNIPGVADQTATMTAAANTWQQITVNFTPTAQGVCRVRLKSRDTGPNGLTIFDDLRRA